MDLVIIDKDMEVKDIDKRNLFFDHSFVFIAGSMCTNNEDYNGTRYGQFRCPLNQYPLSAKYCCGEVGKQYCCSADEDQFVFIGF